MIGADAADELIGNEGATNSFARLQEFLDNKPGFTPGYLSYDLKNELEDLKSENPDHLAFPPLYFFSPKHTLGIKGSYVEISSANPDSIWQEICSQELPNNVYSESESISISSRFSKDEYIQTVQKIQSHIQRGDIYEMNLCQEFYAENCKIDPVAAFIKLNRHSPTPFASFFKVDNKYILSASPERFLSRRGNRLISQPIKGTVKRSADPKIDEIQKTTLKTDEKERAENVMIVDLVRNDLTRSAVPGTVRVEELFGVYSFSQVHQLVSTVVCEARPELSNSQIIANTFPMGSMTGAPKIRAMQLSEKYERSRRGVYSGAAGYFDADGNFDLNVVIRTLLYNSKTGYLSYHTGGAITFDSVPTKEYEECLLKGSAIRDVLENKIPGR